MESSLLTGRSTAKAGRISFCCVGKAGSRPRVLPAAYHRVYSPLKAWACRMQKHWSPMDDVQH